MFHKLLLYTIQIAYALILCLEGIFIEIIALSPPLYFKKKDTWFNQCVFSKADIVELITW